MEETFWDGIDNSYLFIINCGRFLFYFIDACKNDFIENINCLIDDGPTLSFRILEFTLLVSLTVFVRYCLLWICSRRAAKIYRNKLKNMITAFWQLRTPQAYFDLCKLSTSLELNSACYTIRHFTGSNMNKLTLGNTLIEATHAEACYLVFIGWKCQSSILNSLPMEIVEHIFKYIHCT